MLFPSRWYLRWLWAIGFSGALWPSHGQSQSLETEIAKILKYESAVDFQLVPGILVGVVFKDTSYICSFGNTLSPDSMYELGGVTQPLVFWLAKKALDSLGIALTDPVCRILPDSLCLNTWDTITIQHLLNHAAGLPRLPPSAGLTKAPVEDPFAAYYAHDLAIDVSALHPVRDQFSYSYFGYGLLYWLFEKVGGLNAFTNKMMAQALRMEHTEWNVPDSLIATGVGRDGRPQPPWHCSALATALGLKSSMNDLMIWVKRAVQDAEGISSSNQHSYKKASKSSEKLKSAEAGWFLLKRGSKIYYFHAGRTGRHYVSIAWIPGMERGVVVICNGASGSGDLGIRILDMLCQTR